MGLTIQGLGGAKHVRSCPVTAGSSGVMKFAPAVIAAIAGATSHKDEWLLWLLGERSADGYEIHVTGYHVPPQKRGGAHADLANQTEGEVMPADLVGVIHLHPWVGKAWFSTTDHNELNPLYPSSIVVSPAANLLGFTYSAEGKVKLPCGSTGVVKMVVAVDGNANFAAEPVRGQYSADYKSLGDCNRYTESDAELVHTDASACGLSESRERHAIFGYDGGALIAAVEAATVAEPPRQVRLIGNGNNDSRYSQGKGLPAGYGSTGSSSSAKPAGMSRKAWKRQQKRRRQQAEDMLARRSSSAVQYTMTNREKGWECDLCQMVVDTVYHIDGDDVCELCKDWLARYESYKVATDADASAGFDNDGHTCIDGGVANCQACKDEEEESRGGDVRLADLINSEAEVVEYMDAGNGKLVRVL